jgi:hypothetical protein
MNNKYFTALLAAPLVAFMALPSYADSTTAPASTTMPMCKDGTTSTVAGKGACSHHGGVKKAAAGGAMAAAPAAATADTAAASGAATAPAAKSTTAMKSAPSMAASATDPTGATAKCKDGTYSHAKTHSGACSKHGGVADWLTK